VATWADVRQVALALPETSERSARDGVPEWRVRDVLFAWERPLRQRDVQELRKAVPGGPVLAARVPDIGVKEALLAEDDGVYFTTSHFDGYPVVLVQLDQIDPAELEELLVEAWLARAPKRLAKRFLDDQA
jgi:hypothetical protein